MNQTKTRTRKDQLRTQKKVKLQSVRHKKPLSIKIAGKEETEETDTAT